MMRYISSNPDSLDLIHKIVTETFEEINITLDNLRVFWFDSLLPHLEKDVSGFNPNTNAVIAKLYLAFGRWFWTRLDLQKTPYFENFQSCSILHRSLYLMKLGAGNVSANQSDRI